jgi:hypothetical protein
MLFSCSSRPVAENEARIRSNVGVQEQESVSKLRSCDWMALVEKMPMSLQHRQPADAVLLLCQKEMVESMLDDHEMWRSVVAAATRKVQAHLTRASVAVKWAGLFEWSASPVVGKLPRATSSRWHWRAGNPPACAHQDHLLWLSAEQGRGRLVHHHLLFIRQVVLFQQYSFFVASHPTVNRPISEEGARQSCYRRPPYTVRNPCTCRRGAGSYPEEPLSSSFFPEHMV